MASKPLVSIEVPNPIPEPGPPEDTRPMWHTRIKLGSAEEAGFCGVGDVVDSVDRASGEIRLSRRSDSQPFPRSEQG